MINSKIIVKSEWSESRDDMDILVSGVPLLKALKQRLWICSVYACMKILWNEIERELLNIYDSRWFQLWSLLACSIREEDNTKFARYCNAWEALYFTGVIAWCGKCNFTETTEKQAWFLGRFNLMYLRRFDQQHDRSITLIRTTALNVYYWWILLQIDNIGITMWRLQYSENFSQYWIIHCQVEYTTYYLKF